MLIVLVMLSQISTSTLVDEMTDLDRLTLLPTYTIRQFSSYDRKRHDRENAKNWFANKDTGNYLRRDGDELVLAESEGPGAIVRIWSANPHGKLRIYLDGAIALEEDFGALLRGHVKEFPAPFGAERSRGCNLYYPFPYAKSMKVTCSEGGQYYHVNVRTYPKDTPIETFTRKTMPPLPVLLVKAVGEETDSKQLKGPGVVRAIEIPLPEDEAALRSETIEIEVDGKIMVWSPLGVFFGTGPGLVPYYSMVMGISNTGTGYCYFPMPFQESFRIRVKHPVKMWWTHETRPLRFHAWYRGKQKVETYPRSDWPVLHAKGRGRLVGCFLMVANPAKAWWGEGDEKIFVDGEDFPSTFGTGTEDYFGYAWGSNAPFQAPYHNQTRCDGPGNRGYSAMARYHVLDDIPFSSSLQFDLEIWHILRTTMGFSTVAYWYSDPEGSDDFETVKEFDWKIPALPEYVVYQVKGAIEAETLKVVEGSDGEAQEQDMFSLSVDRFSDDAHLWWRNVKTGDVLELEFPSSVVGDHDLILNLTQSFDYGIVNISVNGKVLEEKLDLYFPEVKPLGERLYSKVPLKALNELRVEIVGTNPKAHPKNHMFGMDYLRIPEGQKQD